MAIDHEAVERGDKRLSALAEDYLKRPGVDWGRMFATTGLRVRGKVFGLVDFHGWLMVKVPQARATALVGDGDAERVEMNGRLMREWVRMPFEAGEPAWRALLDEAYRFLDEITPR